MSAVRVSGPFLPSGVDPDRFHGRRGHHRRPQFAECALHRLRHLLVLERHHAGHVLHHGDLHAQRGVEPRELAADGARAYDDHRFGQPGERQRLARRNHVPAVNGHERHFARARPRGEDDMVGFVVRAVDLEPACRRQAPEALYEVYVVFLQQEGHALGHGFGHAARARHDLFRVGAHLAREGEPVMLRRFAIGVDLCAFQQRLGRDAAPVEAYAARLGTLHECDLPSQLRSPDCGHIAARAASYDDDIVFHSSILSL